MTIAPPALRVDGITKRFGTLLANDTISFEVARGEILALLGENGAGKTTLMNIVFGHYVADAGRVDIDGVAVPPGDPRAALAAGIGMVHQHFALADNMTVLDNVMLGSESLWRPLSNRRAGRAKLRALATDAGLATDPDLAVGQLTVGEKQRVEILKALYRDARLLILDEPTAVLTPQEAETLFITLRRLVARGMAIVFISHKLNEVRAIADRIAVLRQGRLVMRCAAAEASNADLASAMVGRTLPQPRFAPGRPGAVALGLRGLVAESPDRRQALRGIDLDLHAGEMVGIAGVAGNGQALLADILCGMAMPRAGMLAVDGVPLKLGAARRMIDQGFGRIPEDRHAAGVVGALSVAENATLERLADPRFARHGWRDRRAAAAHAAAIIADYDVRGATPQTRTGLLSGGNMQKLILGRVLGEAPRVIIANQPTRGLDIGAVAFVQARLDAARAAGAAILLISEDLEELLAMCDRIAVMFRGHLSPPLPAATLDPRLLGLMMAGAAPALAETSHAP